MDVEWFVCDLVFLLGLVFFEKIWGVDDVVMIVDIVEEVLYERVWLESKFWWWGIVVGVIFISVWMWWKDL